MKIKLDENLPVGLRPVLEKLGHNVDTVVSEGLSGHGDDDIWAASQQSGRFLVTQDLDFSDIRRFEPGYTALTLRRGRVTTDYTHVTDMGRGDGCSTNGVRLRTPYRKVAVFENGKALHLATPVPKWLVPLLPEGVAPR